jgi:hypothetical protein
VCGLTGVLFSIKESDRFWAPFLRFAQKTGLSAPIPPPAYGGTAGFP